MNSTPLNIKSFIFNLCKDKVSGYVLADIPKIIPSSVSDFVVVSTPATIRGYTDYNSADNGQGLVMVTLFAKDSNSKLFGAEENVSKLNTMLTSLRTELGKIKYSDGIRVLEQGFHTPRNSYEGFHALNVILNVKTL